MKKHILVLILVIIIAILTSNIIAAAPVRDIKVFLDGQELIFDQKPIIENERVMVPLRAIFEKMGADIYWNGGTKTATAILILEITINNKIASINDRIVELDVPAKVINERTLVPLRFISESLGTKVDWDENTKTVFISSLDRKDIIPDMGVPLYQTLSDIIIKEARESYANELRPNIRMINFKMIDKENNEVIAEVTPKNNTSLDLVQSVRYNQNKVKKGKTYEFQATIVNFPTEALPKPTTVEGTFLNLDVRLDANMYDRTTKPNEEYINFVQSYDRPDTIPYLETAHFKWDYTIPENFDYVIRLTPSVNYEHYHSIDNFNPEDDWMDIIMNVTDEDDNYQIFHENGKKELSSYFPINYILSNNPSGVSRNNNKDDLKWLHDNFNYSIFDEIGYSQWARYTINNEDNEFTSPRINITLADKFVEMSISNEFIFNEDSKKVFLHTLKYFLGNDYQNIYNRLTTGQFDGNFKLSNREISMGYNLEYANFYIFIGKPGAKFNFNN